MNRPDTVALETPKTVGENDPQTHKLTVREAKFVEEYLIDGNATRAHKAAGFGGKNNGVHASEASRLLRKPKVAAAIARAQKVLATQAITNQREVQKQFCIVAYSDISDYVTWDATGMVTVKAYEDIDPKKLGALKVFKKSEVETRDKEGNVVSVRRHFEIVMHDKVRALEGLARQLGMNNPPKEEPKPLEIHYYDHRRIDEIMKDRLRGTLVESKPGIEIPHNRDTPICRKCGVEYPLGESRRQ